MDNQTIEDLRKQHIDSYQNAILDIIQNNTNVLIDDISSLVEKPPLDSMDAICNKLYGEAKKYKIVFNSDEVNQLLENYRNKVKECFDEIKSLRIKTLSSKLNHFKFIDDNDTFILYKKDFTSLNKDIKKMMKNQIITTNEDYFLKNIYSIFQEDTDVDIQNKIIQELSKYMNGNCQKQIMDSFDIKIMVKDTTLMNSIKEQGERYLFTLNNSRLLNPFE